MYTETGGLYTGQSPPATTSQTITDQPTGGLPVAVSPGSTMSEKSETESERDLDNIEVISEPDGSSKRSSLRSAGGGGGGGGGSLDRNDSSPPPHQVSAG